MDFGKLILKRMQQKNINYRHLAKLAGLSQPYCWELINGKKRWNEHTLLAVCRALDMEVLLVPAESVQEGRGRSGVKCERCGGYTDDPIRDGNRWICDSCVRLLFESTGWNTD